MNTIHQSYIQKKALLNVPENANLVQQSVTDFVNGLLEECEASIREAPDGAQPAKVSKMRRSHIRQRAYGSKIVQKRDRRHRQDISKFVFIF